MGALLRLIIEAIVQLRILSPILRPVIRFTVGFMAVPLFRMCLHRVFRVQQLSRELAKDLEQWFRCSLVLLVATRNMDSVLFGWISQEWRGDSWIAMGLRIMLAVGVVEGMPDQALFSIIHPGPEKLIFPKGRRLRALREQFWPIMKGLACKHLNRSSPVLAIMCAIFAGPVGWVCYFAAITQYLIIGLVSSRDAALDALAKFDEQYLRQRAWIAERVADDGDEPADAAALSGSEAAAASGRAVPAPLHRDRAAPQLAEPAVRMPPP